MYPRRGPEWMFLFLFVFISTNIVLREGDVTYWHLIISVYCMLYFVYTYLSKQAHYVNLEDHTHPHSEYEQAGITVFDDVLQKVSSKGLPLPTKVNGRFSQISK